MLYLLSNRSSPAGLEAFALALGDKELQERAEELREMLQPESHPELVRLRRTSEGSSEARFYLTIRSAWSELYGADLALWPERSRNSLETIKAGIGFGNFGQNVTAALQNLRLDDVTYPAFEAGIAVIGSSSLQAALVELNWRTLKGATPKDIGFIPDPAARAGLSFIGSPLTLIAPIWLGGMTGRAATAGAARVGQMLWLAEEAIVSLGTIFGLTAESAGFVGASDVIASLPAEGGRAKQSSEETFMHGIASVASLPRNDMLTETTAATFFFGGLRMFGWAGSVAQRTLPATEVGVALAKLTGHTTSVAGLASMEEVQAAAGIGAQTGRGGALSPPSREPAEGLPYRIGRASSATTYYERLWRALFLHATISGVRKIVSLEGVRSEAEDIRGRAEGLLEVVGEGFHPLPKFWVPAEGRPYGTDVSRLADARSRPNSTLMMSGSDDLYSGLPPDRSFRESFAVRIASPSLPFAELAKNPDIRPRLKLALKIAEAGGLGKEDAWMDSEPIAVAVVGYRSIANAALQSASTRNIALIDQLITGTKLDIVVIGEMEEPHISEMDRASKIGTVMAAFPKAEADAKRIKEKMESAGWCAGIGRVGGRLAIMAVKTDVVAKLALPESVGEPLSGLPQFWEGMEPLPYELGSKEAPLRSHTVKWDGRKEDPALAPTVQALVAGGDQPTEMMIGGGPGGRMVEKIVKPFSSQLKGVLNGPAMEKLLMAIPDTNEAMIELAGQVYKIVFLQGLTMGEEVKSRIDMVADIAGRMGDASKAEMKFAEYEEGQLRLFAEVFDSIASAAASAEQRPYARQLISLLEGSGRDLPGILLLVSRYTGKKYTFQ